MLGKSHFGLVPDSNVFVKYSSACMVVLVIVLYEPARYGGLLKHQAPSRPDTLSHGIYVTDTRKTRAHYLEAILLICISRTAETMLKQVCIPRWFCDIQGKWRQCMSLGNCLPGQTWSTECTNSPVGCLECKQFFKLINHFTLFFLWLCLKGDFMWHIRHTNKESIKPVPCTLMWPVASCVFQVYMNVCNALSESCRNARKLIFLCSCYNLWNLSEIPTPS